MEDNVAIEEEHVTMETNVNEIKTKKEEIVEMNYEWLIDFFKKELVT